MSGFFKILAVVTVALPLASTASAQAVGNKDDQVVIRGCVMEADKKNTSGPRSLIVWSKGDVYLDGATVDIKPSATPSAAATSGNVGPVFYWIDDEDDFARFRGRQVEIVGELSDRLKKGEVEVESKGEFTELEVDLGGRETRARVPSDWLGPATKGKDTDFEIAVRTVDVEKVTALGACGAR